MIAKFYSKGVERGKRDGLKWLREQEEAVMHKREPLLLSAIQQPQDYRNDLQTGYCDGWAEAMGIARRWAEQNGVRCIFVGWMPPPIDKTATTRGNQRRQRAARSHNLRPATDLSADESKAKR